jgi:quinoprotein glucose dehydrogenase
MSRSSPDGPVGRAGRQPLAGPRYQDAAAADPDTVAGIDPVTVLHFARCATPGSRHFTGVQERTTMVQCTDRQLRWLILTGLLAACGHAAPAGRPADSTAADAAVARTAYGEWPVVGGDAGGSRHAAAAQIDTANVRTLDVAWTYRTGDYRVGERGGRFQATPLMVDGTLYLSTPFGRVIALDPATGAERWSYDPGLAFGTHYGDWANRGVATWVDRRAARAGPCRRRIYVAPVDARLIALDATTGRPCAGFGNDGVVELFRDIINGPPLPGEYQVTSPPAVVGDLLIIGSAIADNQRADAPAGVVRAIDARTGALRWSWDPVPRDPRLGLPGSWEGSGTVRTGAANAWAPLAVDAARDLAFVPTSSPSPDYYGGERPGRNDYANSLVALRASTGQVVWHFQVVHHDLWDYDVPAQPVLVTVRRGERDIPAVVQATKQGFLFVLHRETGRPLFPVEERPVPASDVPGERAWPTQPFPVLPAAIVPQRLTAADAWGATDADRQYCRERIAALRNDGIFTPPSLEGTLVYPGNIGGANWSGIAVDPVRGVAYAPANRLAAAVRLVPRAELMAAAHARPHAETAPMRGTPFGVQREFLVAPGGLPCNPPPWGTLTAIDLATGRTLWQQPLGRMKTAAGELTAHGWGSINLGGALSTGGGLIFAAGGFDDTLYAFDAATGHVLWSARLPAGGNAPPMTYVHEGRQFIVIAAGGHDRMGTTPGDYLVAFALPGLAAAGRTDSLPAVSGRFEGDLFVGNARFAIALDLVHSGDEVDGALSGPLSGRASGRVQGSHVTVDIPFALATENCTGSLTARLERANRGTMLVGMAELSGQCSDGRTEQGVLSLRRRASR